MKIDINRLNDGFHLEAVNETGNTVQMDGSPDIGGTGKGMRPMQLLLTALGACGTIDIISILKKQRQPLEDIKITVTGDREKDAVPAPFIAAHIHFRLFGKLDTDKVQKAVSLSVEKYCSVAKTIEKTTKITYSFEII
ncbi:MAG TPA: OsmC family protein [Cyclobacteriaceae bacterium]|nr:OsmC family protein [Cyclobacteriaceae bacterium]